MGTDVFTVSKIRNLQKSHRGVGSRTVVRFGYLSFTAVGNGPFINNITIAYNPYWAFVHIGELPSL